MSSYSRVTSRFEIINDTVSTFIKGYRIALDGGKVPENERLWVLDTHIANAQSIGSTGSGGCAGSYAGTLDAADAYPILDLRHRQSISCMMRGWLWVHR